MSVYVLYVPNNLFKKKSTTAFQNMKPKNVSRILKVKEEIDIKIKKNFLCFYEKIDKIIVCLSDESRSKHNRKWIKRIVSVISDCTTVELILE